MAFAEEHGLRVGQAGAFPASWLVDGCVCAPKC